MELKEKVGHVNWNKGERQEYFGVIGKRVEGKENLREGGRIPLLRP